jgi:transcriptional regulator with XRE-family HTH domain
VPFCHLTFSAVRPPLLGNERVKVPEGTLGGAFRAQRRTLGLEQREVAEKLGVSSSTYRSWEVNRSKPALRYVPNAIAFLGYDWRATSNSPAELLRLKRTRRGWSLRNLARRAGVDWTTIRAWERNEHRPTRRALAAVEEALGDYDTLFL